MINIENQIIIDNQNLIYSIINTYFSTYSNKNDLFQAGCIGLLKAAKNYDESYNTKFSTYAYTFIFGEISASIREDKGIKVSTGMQKLAYKVEKVRLLLYQKLMREPSISELSNYLELPIEKVTEILNIPNNIQSLDEPVNDGLSLYECVSDSNKLNIDDLIALKNELEKLSPVEKKLISARYEYDMTQSEVAKILGMSQVQISRNEKKVLVRLKDRLSA